MLACVACSMLRMNNSEVTSTKFSRNWHVPKKHSFLSNYRFTIFTNKKIYSILTLFPSCKHRHQYYIEIIRIFEQLRYFYLFFSKHAWPPAWNMKFRMISLITNISGKLLISRSLLFTKENREKKSIILSQFSHLKFLSGPIIYIWYLLQPMF